MFFAMYVNCRGAKFCDPTLTLSHKSTGDGFVNDIEGLGYALFQDLRKRVMGW
jgi:hypothetical protein